MRDPCQDQKIKIKQVRTNIGLADTLIPSSFLVLIYMRGTGLYDSIKIIFGYHVNSQHIILNIKLDVNRMFHVVMFQYRTLWTDDDHFWQCYLELVYKLCSLLWCRRQSVGLIHRMPLVRTPVRRQIVFLNLLTTLRKY